ncbi:MAG: hypothetical protein AAGF01_01600 [Cyanobacteria bacterium P01_G01_bin.38]
MDTSDETSPFESKELIIGVRTAAYEIGHDVQDSRSGGFCGTFGRELEATLENRNVNVKFRAIENNYLDDRWERYDGLRENIIDVECGPNSSPVGSPVWADGISFSKTPFHVTGVKLLMRRSVLENIPNGSIDQSEVAKRVTVAVVKETTTWGLLNRVQGLKVEATEGRDAALDLLQRNPDYTYASDALIVKTLLDRDVSELKSADGEIIRKARDSYKSLDFIAFPADESYIGDRADERYVIAIKRGTSYEDDLMDAIEDTLNSQDILAKREELKQAETSIPLLPSRNTGFELPALWVIAAPLALISILLLIFYLIFRRSGNSHRYQRSIQRESNQEGTGQSQTVTVKQGDIHVNIDSVIKGDAELRKTARDIQQILDSIDNSPNPGELSKAQARVEGAKLHSGNSPLKDRLLAAFKAGALATIEGYIEHPLAKGFLEGFKEILNR